MSTNTRNFSEGPIAVQLIKFALPVLMALFLQSLYGAVDLLIVGQFATSADVSGVSTGSQLLLTLTSIVASLSMGLTIILGQKVGCGSLDGPQPPSFFVKATSQEARSKLACNPGFLTPAHHRMSEGHEMKAVLPYRF